MEDVQLNVWNVTEVLLRSRVIKLYGEITTQLSNEVCALLDVLSFDNPEEPIKLEINTPGGEVLAGLAIVDKIQEISCPVIAFNKGLCASMGTVISSACDYVYGSENTQFMIHEVSSGAQGKFRDMKNSVAFDEQLNQRVIGIIAKKCNKTYNEIMEKAVYDFWLEASEAKAYGLIDAILPKPKKSTKAIKEFNKNISK